MAQPSSKAEQKKQFLKEEQPSEATATCPKTPPQQAPTNKDRPHEFCVKKLCAMKRQKEKAV